VLAINNSHGECIKGFREKTTEFSSMILPTLCDLIKVILSSHIIVFLNKHPRECNKKTGGNANDNDDDYLGRSAVWSEIVNNSGLMRIKENSKPQVLN